MAVILPLPAIQNQYSLMTKQKTLLLIPLAIISGFLIYTWTIILFTDIEATWRHYVALGLFGTLTFLYFKNFKMAVLATGFYLILGSCNVFTLTPSVTTNCYGLKIGSLELWTPTLQIISCVI